MRIRRNRTYLPKKGDIKRYNYIVDAKGKVLGRMAAKIATVLRGKNKPDYTPHTDCGDYVVVVNAEKIVMTGKQE